jgi:hypothetical protein
MSCVAAANAELHGAIVEQVDAGILRLANGPPAPAAR